jgi:hypothetical protein
VLGTERVDETRVNLAPARHLLPESAHLAVDGVERGLLPGDAVAIEPHVDARTPELRPIRGKHTDEYAAEYDTCDADDDETLGNVELDDPGAVPTHDKQAETVTAAQAG